MKGLTEREDEDGADDLDVPDAVFHTATKIISASKDEQQVVWKATHTLFCSA